MDNQPPITERARYTHLTKLNILVHPLFNVRPRDDTPDIVAFGIAREEFAGNILRSMVPTSQTEVTMIAPLVINANRRETLKHRVDSAKNNFAYIQWTDLYRKMVSQLGNGRNIVMGSNLFENATDGRQDPMLVRRDLANRGFVLDGDTDIFVGGELLNSCLKGSVETIMQLPEVKSVKVVKSCTLNNSYLLGDRTGDSKYHNKRFKEFFEGEGMNVVENIDYFIISKNQSERFESVISTKPLE